MSAALPSAAAAAGAAAAAMLQRQLAQEKNAEAEGGWTEHQTGDGRKFFYHEETSTSTWEKPPSIMNPDERKNDTVWREYRIWDGRVFYHNRETKVSCWSVPPEIRRLRGESSGVDDRPLPETTSEKLTAFWELLKEKGVGDGWTFGEMEDATRGDPRAEVLNEEGRKQVFSEQLDFSMRRRLIEERENERDAAGALERLIEERFKPEDLATSYAEAATLLAHEEAWIRIKSDVKRDEVFQKVMESLEQKHKESCSDRRAERVVRLQRLIGSDPEFKRPRLRWKEAHAILSRREDLEEDPPLETLRVWASLQSLRPAEQDKRPDTSVAREERRRRDAFVGCLKDMVHSGTMTADSPWSTVEPLLDNDSRCALLRAGPGATAWELFDEFQEELRRTHPRPNEIPKRRRQFSVKEEIPQDGEAKRARFDPEVPVKNELEGVSALDLLIAPTKEEALSNVKAETDTTTAQPVDANMIKKDVDSRAAPRASLPVPSGARGMADH